MKLLDASSFLERVASIAAFRSFRDLRRESLETENVFRELFARQRDSWEVPEVDDPLLFLVNVFENSRIFRKLPDFPEDTIPRCFELETKIPPGCPSIVSQEDFDISWECFTEGILRFINWNNVFCAGGSVTGCLLPLPKEIQEANPSRTRVLRRRFFHDQFLPSSDIDLFLYGLDETAAVEKLKEIYDAIQAASPYEIRAFRSEHAVTLVSRYPFRHVQIVLRLYNSPSEILMGFDVDSCAVGYNGKHVYMCPRTVMAFISQTNTVDMSRRSPSYEMRLAKYAQRGFEILVDDLNRERIDPFLYERRFDQNKGLSRLLMLERLRTPEERLRYRLGNSNEWTIQRKIRKLAGDKRNIERVEGYESIVPNIDSGPEASNYSTVFLPWGPEWTVNKIERMTKKKDKILNAIEFLPDGRVVANRKKYKIHVCAVGTIDEILDDPFPDDPPIPSNVHIEALDGLVRGKLTWLVDNPGRQQIGSFHPVTNEDWTEGAYISQATEELILAANADDAVKLTKMLSDDTDGRLLRSRDFLGRTALHVASLADATGACKVLLEHPGADAAFLQARLADGRNALHLAVVRGNPRICALILSRRNTLIAQLIDDGLEEADAISEILDIDCSDWNAKMSPLNYAVALGYVEIVRLLLSTEFGCNARKVAVHKDKNMSLSAFDLLALYASESGKAMELSTVREMAELLVAAGASAAQVDTSGSTAWHTFAACRKQSSIDALRIVLKVHSVYGGGKVSGIDILDSSLQTPLYLATACGNSEAVRLMLEAGAKATFSEESWEARVQKTKESSIFTGRQNYYHGRHNLGDSIKRSPIFLAAANADALCLNAFLSHDRSLASAVIRIPKSSTNRRQQTEMIEVCPLNVTEMTRTLALSQKTEEEESQEKDRLTDRFEMATQRMEKARMRRDYFPKGSYEYFSWTIICSQLEQIQDSAKKLFESIDLCNEDQEDEKNALEQIEEAVRVLRASGGKMLPTDDAENDSRAKQPAGTPSHDITDIRDPWDCFSELEALTFYKAVNLINGNNCSYHQASSLSPGLQAKIMKIFQSSWRGDTSLLAAVLLQSKVCTVDRCGVTPLFAASMAGSTESFAMIYAAADEQFCRFVEKQENLKRAQDGDAIETEDNESIVKNQLRRLNNLEIAAGEVPRDAGPTPDMIRQRLAAAEAAALNQDSIEVIKQGVGSDAISSCVPPETMLLHRSIVLSRDSHLPKLLHIQQKMRQLHPASFPDEVVGQPVRLRPIEVAVLKGDIQMLKTIRRLVFDHALVKHVEILDEEVDINLLTKDDSRSESQDGDSCYSSLDDRDIPTDDLSRISPLHLRYLLYGDGSRNPDLNMTLVQLAVALDDTDVLFEIAEVAREHLLPRAAVGIWKSKIDEMEELNFIERQSRDDETKKIMGDFAGYSSWRLKVPLWAPSESNMEAGNSERIHAHPSLLQTALSFGAAQITRSLLSGEADEPLLGWVLKSKSHDFALKGNRRNADCFGFEEALAAASWLCNKVSVSNIEISTLSRQLLSVWAQDSIGRTALFYAPVEFIEEIATSAGGFPVGSFLDMATTKGSVTALMAAASARQLERVEALINVGCSRQVTCGPNNWGPLHLALPSPGLLNRTKPGSDVENIWAGTREIIQSVLAGASYSDIVDCVLCPKAEHSPLMVAIDRCADPNTLNYLVGLLAEKPLKGLAARDKELNTLLHHAVSSLKPESVETLLSKDYVTHELGPNVENADGRTPLDVALSMVSSPWSRLTSNKGIQLTSRTSTRRQQLSRGALPPKIDRTPRFSSEISERHIVSLLKRIGNEQARMAVDFESVKISRKNAAEKARISSDKRSNNDEQSYPSGNPMVLPAYQKPYRYSSYRIQEPQLWNGWPSIF